MTPGLRSARCSATAGAADIVQVHEVARISVLAARASTLPGAQSARRAKRRGILRGRELRRVATRALRAVASRRHPRVAGSYPQFRRRAERNRSVRAGPTAQARYVGQADGGEGRRRWADKGGGSAECRPSRRGASPRIGWRPEQRGAGVQRSCSTWNTADASSVAPRPRRAGMDRAGRASLRRGSAPRRRGRPYARCTHRVPTCRGPELDPTDRSPRAPA